MKLEKTALALSAVLALSASSFAQAETIWDEPVNGDLSNDGRVPTLLTFVRGGNEIHGSVGNGGAGIDRDYFSFTIAPGMALTALILLGDTNVSGGASFLALQPGPQVTVSPDGAGVEALLGYLHYGNDRIGQNLLTLLSGAGPLASGTYSVWVQETGGPASYGLNFEVSAVPVPAAAWLLLSGLAGIATWRRRLSSG